MPLPNGFTPAENGRKLHSTLLLAPEKLTPKWPETEQLRKTELQNEHKHAQTYNRRHHASVQPEPKLGNKGWVTDKSSPAIIVQKSPSLGRTWSKPTNPFRGKIGDNWSKPQPLLPPGERKER